MSMIIQNISGGYGKKMVCKNISFDIQENEIVCIVGPNGSGKTTLLKLILNVLKKTNGSIVIDDVPSERYSTQEMAKLIGYVPQQHTIHFSLTVFEMVLMGRTSYVSTFSLPTKNDEQRALESLQSLKIAHLANEYYDTLSNGQKQMVLIARAVCQQAKILIMDEPTSSLDYANQSLVIATIQSLSKQGFSMIITSHNLDQPFLYAHRVLMLKQGTSYAFGKPSNVITNENLSHVYDVNMEIVSTKDSIGNIKTFCITTP